MKFAFLFIFIVLRNKFETSQKKITEDAAKLFLSFTDVYAPADSLWILTFRNFLKKIFNQIKLLNEIRHKGVIFFPKNSQTDGVELKRVILTLEEKLFFLVDDNVVGVPKMLAKTIHILKIV
jgi:hypothetical protein